MNEPTGVDKAMEALATAMTGFSERAAFATADALRTCARYTARDVRRSLRQRYELKVRELRNLKAYRRRRKGSRDVYFTAFFGVRRKLIRPRARLVAEEVALLESQGGWFTVPVGPNGRNAAKPWVHDYVLRRKGSEPWPVEVYKLDLEPIARDMLEDAARRHWRQTFAPRLLERLRAMEGRAKTVGEWAALRAATARAESLIGRIGEVPDAGAG